MRGATPEVAIIGAGISGICLGIKLKEAGIDSFTIFEKSDGVGGTWRDNSYPGSGCDVPSMLYSFSFELKTDWSRKFSEQAEILAYLEHCTEKYGLRPHIRFHTEIVEARFEETLGRWNLFMLDGNTHRAHVLVSAVGQLNRPHYPTIDGLDGFQGKTFHSARWNHQHDLGGERVAVIGNGASAIQFIPRIAPVVRTLHVFQRSPNWMIPRLDRPYRTWEKRLFTRVPAIARLLRFLTWARLEARWPAFSKNSRLGRKLAQFAVADMQTHVSDPELEKVLVPEYPVGCKRILISDDYYPALERENVEMVTSPITRITADAIETGDGATWPVETIIFATGFESTEFLAPMNIHGLGTATLADAWRHGAEGYLGIALAGFPNFFMLYGPNTNLGHNSIIFMVELQVAYAMACINRLMVRDLKYLDLHADAMVRYNDAVQRSLRDSVWSAGCKSWYKTAAGKITNNWPHSTITYRWRTRRPVWRDFRETPRDAATVTS